MSFRWSRCPIFPNEEVGEFYNQNFINVKLDMEKGEGLKFRRQYPVSAFPTLYYIDYTGKVVQKVVGGQSVEGFLGQGKLALRKIDRSGQYAEAYEDGDRDPELVYNYVRSLNQAGKSSLSVANEYIDKQEDLTTDFNLKFILEAAVEADSKIFSMLIKNRDRIEELTSKEAVNEKILEACRATVKKAMEYRMAMLLDEAISKMQDHYPKRADRFELESQMDFHAAMGEADDFLKACKTFAKKEARKDPEALHELVLKIVKSFNDNDEAMAEAEEYAEEAAKQGQRHNYYLTYAAVLLQNGKPEEAKEAANKSRELAENQDPGSVRRVEMFLRQISG